MNLVGRSISPIGFGCGPLGVHGFGEVDLAQCRSAVQMALDQGITFFDTSDAYGRGCSEEQLALALGSRRNSALISTKGGIRFNRDDRVIYDNSIIWLNEAIHASLKRLKSDHIELYQLHYWDKRTPLDEIFSFFERFVQAGKIGAYGISNCDLSNKDAHFFSCFPNFVSHSCELSMLYYKKLALVKSMAKKGDNIIFLATGVLAQGLLSGKYNIDSKFPNTDRRNSSKYVNFDTQTFLRSQPLLDQLIDSKFPPVALATAWVLRYSPKTIALVGVKSPEQLADIIKVYEVPKSDEFWTNIDEKVSQF